MEKSVTPPIENMPIPRTLTPIENQSTLLPKKPDNTEKTNKDEKLIKYEKTKFKQRNLEHIQKLQAKKIKEEELEKEEKRKLEESREKVRKIVLARAEMLRKKTDPSIEKTSESNKGKLGNYFRSHYVSLLDTINKPGTSASQAKPEKIEKLPDLVKPSSKKEKNSEKEKKKMSKETADKLRERQEKYLQQLAEKKNTEKLKIEEIKEKKEKLEKKLTEEARLKMISAKTCDPPLKPTPHNEEIKEIQPNSIQKQAEIQKQHEDFIARNIAPKKPDVSGVTDLGIWKKKMKLEENIKVFIIMGGYPDIKKALKRRGWVENKQKRSPCFDFKWTLKVKHIEFPELQDFQIVNHFEKNTLITTKAGLCRNLRNLIWYSNVDIDTFYPRCFDLADPAELADFCEEFKTVKAECILKDFILGGPKSLEKIGEERLMVALNICEKRMRDIDDILDEPNPDLTLVTADEWEILGFDELSPDALAKKKHEAWFTKLMKKYDPIKIKHKKPKKKLESAKKEENLEIIKSIEDIKETKQKSEKTDEKTEDESEHTKLRTRILEVLAELRKKYPQFDLNGIRNVWIVKPAGMSRGRGIRIFNNLAEIVDYAQCREQQFIVQKYIENPMIILNRKYDIRQWVLITGWNTISIWFYSECYIRFGAIDYDATEITNRYMHLTNNSVTKHFSKNQTEEEIEGNMWDQDEYIEYIKKQYGNDQFTEKIQPMMKKIVKWSIDCIQETMIDRQKSCEILGYDFMVDENCNPWLIEINSSPAFDYSTPVTTRLVKQVSEDIVKVMVDYYGTNKKKRAGIDTGGFQLIHKGKKSVDGTIPLYGVNLICEVKKIKI